MLVLRRIRYEKVYFTDDFIRFTFNAYSLAAGNVKINDFSANITSGTIPLHTRFTGDVTGDVTTWRWEFHNIGTGATTYSSSNPSTHHNFGKPGVYDVTLKVWGPDGNDTLTKPAYVTATACACHSNNRRTCHSSNRRIE